MPRYTVTDPDSGQSLVLEGDSPPTESELNDIFSQVKSPPAPRSGLFKSPEEIKQPTPITTLGPLGKNRPYFGEIAQQETSPEQRMEAFEKGLTTPPVAFPKAPPVSKSPPGLVEKALTKFVAPGDSLLSAIIGDDAAAQVNRSLVNQAISLPEFFTTPMGMLTAGLGGVGKGAQTAISAYFTQDMLRSALSQSKDLVKNWPKMTAAERADAIVNVLGATGMGTMAGLHTAGAVKGHVGHVLDKAEERQAMLGKPEAGNVLSPEAKAWAQTFGAGFAPPAETENVRTSPEAFTPGEPNRLTVLRPAGQGDENAIQERSATPSDVGQTPGDSSQMGTRVPEPEKPPLPQEENKAATQPEVIPEWKKDLQNAMSEVQRRMDPRHPLNIIRDFKGFSEDLKGKIDPEYGGKVALKDGRTLIVSKNIGDESEPYRITNIAKEGMPSGHMTFRNWNEVTRALWGERNNTVSIENGRDSVRQEPLTPAKSGSNVPEAAVAPSTITGSSNEGKASEMPAEPGVNPSTPAAVAAPAEAKKRVARGISGIRRFNAETQEVGSDLLDWITQTGGMMSRSQARAEKGREWYQQNKSDWDDAPQSLSAVHHNVIYGGKRRPNQVAQDAYNDGQISAPTTAALWDAIKKSSAGRVSKMQKRNITAETTKRDIREQEAWVKATSSGNIEVVADRLKVGETLEVDGERIEVTNVDPETGEVALKDGRKFGEKVLQEGQKIWVQSYDEKPVEDFGFPGDEELKPEPPEPAPAPAPQPKPEAPLERSLELEREFGLSPAEAAVFNNAIEAVKANPSKWTTLAEGIQKEAIRLAAPTGVSLEKTGDLNLSKAIAKKYLSEASAGVKALGVREPESAGRNVRETPPPAKSEEGARKTPTPAVEQRPLTKAEQNEFQDLSIIARKAREEGGPQLTTDQTKRYEYLSALAGQMDLLAEDNSAGIRSRIKQLREKADQMDKLRIKTQQRAFDSRMRREELFKEARTYDEQAKAARAEAADLEKKLPPEPPKPEPQPEPISPKPEPPQSSAGKEGATTGTEAAKFGGETPVGTVLNGFKKVEFTKKDGSKENRWFKVNEDGSLGKLPVNAKQHAQLESDAKAGPPPEETRTPEQILKQSAQVKVKLPEGATVLRITDSKGKKAEIFLKDLNSGENVLRGVDIKKMEAGRITRDGFAPIKGDVQVSEVKKTRTDNLLTPVKTGPSMSREAIDKHIAEKYPGSKIKVINDPYATWAAQAEGTGKNLTGLTVNEWFVESPEHLDYLIEHEFAHAADYHDDIQPILDHLSTAERTKILNEIKARYRPEKYGAEMGAMGLQEMANAWRGRGWFDKLVGTIQHVATKVGFKLTRLSAERAAAKAIADAVTRGVTEPGEGTIRKDQALIRTPEERAKEIELGRVGAVGQSPFQVDVRIAGAYGDPARMMDTRAEQLNISERARRILGLPRMSEMFALSQSGLRNDMSIFGYADARNWAKDKSPNEQWQVTGDAWKSLGAVERKWDQIESGYNRIAARVDSESFQRKLRTAGLREAQAEAAVEAQETFRNIRQAEIADLAQKLIDRKVDDAVSDTLRRDLSQARGLLNLSRNVAERMNEIVSKVFRNYWEMGADSRTPQGFYDLFMAVSRRDGNPITNAESQAYYRLASEVLGVNRNLTQRLMYLEWARQEPDFAAAINAYGKAFAGRMEKDPIAAMRELIAKGEKLATNAERAKEAWKTINRSVMKDLTEFAAFEEAKMVKDSIQSSSEWKQLLNLVNQDAEAFHIPPQLREKLKAGHFDEGEAHFVQVDPTGKVHELDLGFDRDTAAAAQEKIKTYLNAVSDWLNNPENENHPDRPMWERQHDFIDSLYNSSGVFNPTAARSLIWKSSGGMPEFLFRQMKLPAAKIVQTMLENWRRAQTKGSDWVAKYKERIVRVAREAAQSHGYKTISGPWMQQYREELGNSIAWRFRHNLKVEPGMRINGHEVTAADLDYLRTVGAAENERFRDVNNIGVGRVMPEPLLLDRFMGTFGLRRPKEFGTEPKTTVSRQRSTRGRILSTRMSKLAGDDLPGIQKLLEEDQNWPWVVRWLNERSPDYTAVTPFEDAIRSTYEKINRGEPSGSGQPLDNIDSIVDEISSNLPEEYTPERVKATILGAMHKEILGHFNAHYRAEPNPDIRVVSATRESAFTRGFEHDTSNSFMYDYGLSNKQEIASFAIDSSMYWLTRFQRGLDGLIKTYQDAMDDLSAVRSDPSKLADIKRRNKALFQSGNDFRDFRDMELHLRELKRFRDTIGIWSGEDVAKYESMKTLYRLIDDAKILTLGGFNTLTRVFWGSTVKEGFTMAAFERYQILSNAKAIVSMGMSLSKAVGVALPKTIGRRIGRKLGFAPQLENQLTGFAEEWYNSMHFFGQLAPFGLNFRTPTMDAIRNLWASPVTKGGGYVAQLSENRGLALLQRGAYRALAAAEVPLEFFKTVFPTFGYAVQYDSVARQIHWAIAGIEKRAAKTFDAYEKLGQLGRFDFDNPKSVKNTLTPEEVLGNGILPATITQLSHVNELFRRGSEMSLNDAIIQYWKRLKDAAPEERKNIRLLSADASPESAAKVMQDRALSLASIGLLDIHHAATVNRSWALRQSLFGRVAWPLAGWAVQSTRQWFALMGQAAGDPKLRRSMLTAATVVTIGTALATQVVTGDIEKRIFEHLKWVLYREVDSVKHLGQGKSKWEEARIALSDSLTYITMLNGMVDQLLSATTNRQSLVDNLFVVQKIRSIMSYVSGVVHTHDPLYGFGALVRREAPITRAFVNQLPVESGIVAKNNARTIIQKWAPEELLRQGGSSFGMATQTELTPYKEKLTAAIYNGDSTGTAEAYAAFIEKATQLGRAEPEKLAQQMVRSLNPYSIALLAHPTEQQRADMLAKMPENERNLLLDYETKYLAATQMLGVQSAFVKDETRGKSGGNESSGVSGGGMYSGSSSGMGGGFTGSRISSGMGGGGFRTGGSIGGGGLRGGGGLGAPRGAGIGPTGPGAIGRRLSASSGSSRGMLRGVKGRLSARSRGRLTYAGKGSRKRRLSVLA